MSWFTTLHVKCRYGNKKCNTCIFEKMYDLNITLHSLVYKYMYVCLYLLKKSVIFDCFLLTFDRNLSRLVTHINISSGTSDWPCR